MTRTWSVSRNKVTNKKRWRRCQVFLSLNAAGEGEHRGRSGSHPPQVQCSCQLPWRQDKARNTCLKIFEVDSAWRGHIIADWGRSVWWDSDMDPNLQGLERFIVFRRQVMSDSFAIPWTVAHQAPLSMGFPRQEYWSELPFLSPVDLLHPRIEPESPALAGRFFTSEPPGKS